MPARNTPKPQGTHPAHSTMYRRTMPATMRSALFDFPNEDVCYQLLTMPCDHSLCPPQPPATTPMPAQNTPTPQGTHPTYSTTYRRKMTATMRSALFDCPNEGMCYQLLIMPCDHSRNTPLHYLLQDRIPSFSPSSELILERSISLMQSSSPSSDPSMIVILLLNQVHYQVQSHVQSQVVLRLHYHHIFQVQCQAMILLLLRVQSQASIFVMFHYLGRRLFVVASLL